MPCAARFPGSYTTLPETVSSDPLTSHYTSLAFTDQLIAAGIAGSIRSVRDALDNALMESAIAVYKTDFVNSSPHSWTGRAELERETASWCTGSTPAGFTR